MKETLPTDFNGTPENVLAFLEKKFCDPRVPPNSISNSYKINSLNYKEVEAVIEDIVNRLSTQ